MCLVITASAAIRRCSAYDEKDDVIAWEKSRASNSLTLARKNYDIYIARERPVSFSMLSAADLSPITALSLELLQTAGNRDTTLPTCRVRHYQTE